MVEPPVSERISIHVPAVMTGMLSGINNKNNDDDNSTGEFVDNYNMDCGSSDDDDFTLSEKMVHYLGGHVVPEHWTACKATLVSLRVRVQVS